jgi:TolB-like protein/DNA-binding winged helix-turn-helix (wHTH) protein
MIAPAKTWLSIAERVSGCDGLCRAKRKHYLHLHRCFGAGVESVSFLSGGAMSSPPIGLQQSISFGEDFALDLRPRRLRRRTHVVKLERIPFEILLLLLERPGEVVTREEIVARVWGGGVFLDSDNSIRSAIRKIRQVLKDNPAQPRYIQTITGQGYRFIAPVLALPLEDHGANVPIPEERKELRAEAPLHPPRPGESGILRAHRWLVLALATVLAFAAVYVMSKSRQTDATVPKIRSLAVLPLKNLSRDSGQDYFADGMTEEVIGRLATIRGLRVISRTSVMRFKDSRASVPEIAKALGVDALVEGSVMREGSRVRVHAQLIRAATDEHFWSETYDREMGDVLSLESDIAQAIAEKVEVTITGQERARLGAKRQVSPEVYDNYLKGNFANRNTKNGIEESIGFFNEAINEDPTFAPAYVGLAAAYESLGSVYGGVSPSETRPSVISAARKALNLDPQLAAAHVLLAGTYQREWQWKDAEEEYRLALELKPNDARAHREFAFWLLSQGRLKEAVAWSQRARELDPLGVDGLISHGDLLFFTRHYDESAQDLKSVVAVQPGNAFAHWALGETLIAKGQPEQAIPELENAVLLSDRSPAIVGVLIRAYAHAGRRADAIRLLEELNKRRVTGYVSPAAFVNAYLGLGDKEQAFAWLERGYQEKTAILQYLKVHPDFDSLRHDPRFADLLRRVGLDQEFHSSLERQTTQVAPFVVSRRCSISHFRPSHSLSWKRSMGHSGRLASFHEPAPRTRRGYPRQT